MKVKRIPESKWEWFGLSGHFCCGAWCRFHLCTKVGPWIVSTVGQYVHPRNSGSNEKIEREWLAANPNGEEIGLGRFYETMVFKADGVCECGCGQPNIVPNELDSGCYNDMVSAREGHMRLCSKWARKATP